MRKMFILLTVLAMVAGFSGKAESALKFIGTGTSAHGTYNIIYDTDLDITWYDYTNPPDPQQTQLDWWTQVDWAANLTVNFGGTIYDDWRLPTTLGTAIGYTDEGEMGHLYYTELGNSAGGPLVNTGDFQNLIATEGIAYYSGTSVSGSPSRAWVFRFDDGLQYQGTKVAGNPVLAVHPGLIPEPSTLLLLGTGLTGLAGLIRKKVKD